MSYSYCLFPVEQAQLLKYIDSGPGDGPGVQLMAFGSTKISTVVKREWAQAFTVLACWLFLPAIVFADSGPNFETMSSLEAKILRGRSQCDELLATQPEEMTTRKIIEFQGGLMEERRDDFNGDFIASRVALGYKHWERSVYFYTVDKAGQLTSTFGLTFSDYKSTTKRFSRLPEEDSLNLKKGNLLPRPLAKNGEGFIVEGRTYGILPEHREEAFPGLFKRLLEEIEPRLQRMPELRHRKIIHTYGGREGLLMYRAMGFEIVKDSEPVMAYGTKMYKLQASPDTVARRVEVIQNLVRIDRFQLPLSFSTGKGERPISLGVNADIIFLNQEGTKRTISHFSALEKDTELAPGLWAAAGSGGAFAGKQLLYVTRLARPYYLKELGAYVEANRSLAFRRDGKPFIVGGIDRDVQISGALWAKKGSWIEFTPEGGMRIAHAAFDYHQANGEPGPAGSTVYYCCGKLGGDLWMEPLPQNNAWKIREELMRAFSGQAMVIHPEIFAPITDVRAPMVMPRFGGLFQLTKPSLEGFQFRPDPDTGEK